MKPAENIKKLIKKLNVTPDHENHNKTLNDALAALERTKHKTPVPAGANIWRIIMQNRITKFATLIVIVIIFLGGISLWPLSSENDQWWLGPPAVWGQQIVEELQKVQTLIYRQQVAYPSENGQIHTRTGWERRYNTKDMYRRDRYDNGTDVMNVQWVWSDGENTSLLEISYEYECYFELENEAHGFVPNIMEKSPALAYA